MLKETLQKLYRFCLLNISQINTCFYTVTFNNSNLQTVKKLLMSGNQQICRKNYASFFCVLFIIKLSYLFSCFQSLSLFLIILFFLLQAVLIVLIYMTTHYWNYEHNLFYLQSRHEFAYTRVIVPKIMLIYNIIKWCRPTYSSL